MVFNQPQGGIRTPTPYDKELSAIARRERMAQIMQQQALQPLEINSYQGIQAPISPLQPLAKALQMYAAVTAGDRSDDARAALGQRMQTEAAAQIAGLEGTPAQPAIAPTPGTSFTPTGADFEDNPNLPIAASGDVEVAGSPGRPAIPAMPLSADAKKQRLIQILSSGNPYAAPVAKLMFEDLQKGATGPLAEYNLAVQQGYRGTIDQYKTQQAQAGRSITNVNMPTSMAPMYVKNRITGKMEYVQPDNRGRFDMSNYEPAPIELPIQRLMAQRDSLPEGHPDRAVIQGMINKEATQSFAAGSTVEGPTGTRQTTPQPAAGTVNMMIDGQLTAVPIARAAELNAQFKGAETLGTETARAQLDLVTIPDPKNPANKILVQRSQLAEQAAAGTPALAEVDKKVAQGQSMIELAQRAQAILPTATSGAISNLATMATDAAGIPTNKSSADAQLRVISAALTANVPRMEGPQSNTDLLEYKRAAADVANGNIPYQTRMKALQTVINLNEKYATGGAQPPAGAVRRITPRQ
jgi:hypothetical protein